ncbi:MAG TPA: hypothetical protein VGW74_02065, partial [Propionibacteriaceae bacterium]|nr:hypothetical protein [Propionibacteriaceae bacterium]
MSPPSVGGQGASQGPYGSGTVLNQADRPADRAWSARPDRRQQGSQVQLGGSGCIQRKRPGLGGAENESVALTASAAQGGDPGAATPTPQSVR